MKSRRELEEERDQRLQNLREARTDQIEDMTIATSNLLMTLSRLKFEYFRKMPLYTVGLCGMVAGFLGIQKNWPKKIPSRKKTISTKPKKGSKGDERK